MVVKGRAAMIGGRDVVIMDGRLYKGTITDTPYYGKKNLYK